MTDVQVNQAYSMSLQGSAQYEAVKEAASLERRVEKAMLARHGRPFNATIRSSQVGCLCCVCYSARAL